MGAQRQDCLHSCSEFSIESVPKGLTLFAISKSREILEKMTTVTQSHVFWPVRFENKAIKVEHLLSTFFSIS